LAIKDEPRSPKAQIPDNILRDMAPLANCRGLDLDDDAMSSLAEVLSKSESMVILDLANNKITAEGLKTVVDAILNNPRTVLSKLDLSKNQIGPESNKILGELLANNTTIEELDLSWNPIGDTEYDRQVAQQAIERGEKPPRFGAMDDLAKGLHRNTKVSRLGLSKVQLDDSGAAALSLALPNNSSLRSLDLSVNSIGPVGANKLAEALQQYPMLAELDLNYNQVGAEGARAIASLLISNETIEKVSLRNNNIGTEGAICMSEGIKSSNHVNSVSLGANDVGLLGENYVNLAIDIQEDERGFDTTIETDILRSPRREIPFAPELPKPAGDMQSLLAASPSRFSTRSSATVSMATLHRARAYKALFHGGGDGVGNM